MLIVPVIILDIIPLNFFILVLSLIITDILLKLPGSFLLIIWGLSILPIYLIDYAVCENLNRKYSIFMVLSFLTFDSLVIFVNNEWDMEEYLNTHWLIAAHLLLLGMQLYLTYKYIKEFQSRRKLV